MRMVEHPRGGPRAEPWICVNSKIGLIFEPADFEASAGNRAVFDLGPIVIRHELATTYLAKHLALLGKPPALCLTREQNRFEGRR